MYWDSFWDADDAFYGHVLGFKGLERPAIVLAVNGFREEPLLTGDAAPDGAAEIEGDLGYEVKGVVIRDSASGKATLKITSSILSAYVALLVAVANTVPPVISV